MSKFQELINAGLLKKEVVDFSLIYKIISKSHRSLKSSEILLKDGDTESSYELAYEAMLLAGRALVFSFGFRPRAVGSHKTVVDFVKIALGKDDYVLVLKFNKMRKNRHYLIYGAGLAISEIEARNAIVSAKKLLAEIENIIKKKNPQKNLDV